MEIVLLKLNEMSIDIGFLREEKKCGFGFGSI
jgi:hypothetical protein